MVIESPFIVVGSIPRKFDATVTLVVPRVKVTVNLNLSMNELYPCAILALSSGTFPKHLLLCHRGPRKVV